MHEAELEPVEVDAKAVLEATGRLRADKDPLHTMEDYWRALADGLIVAEALEQFARRAAEELPLPWVNDIRVLDLDELKALRRRAEDLIGMEYQP